MVIYVCVGEAVTGLSITATTTTSFNLRWNDLSPQAQVNLQNYQLIIRRAGREEERSLPFFSRTFSLANLLPGVRYEVTLRGLFAGDVLGVDTNITVTTQEEGKLWSHDKSRSQMIMTSYTLYYSTFWSTFEPRSNTN